MFDKISRSWTLVKASAAVLRSDKELLLFPVISSIAALLVAATFLVPVVGLGLFEGRSIGVLEGRYGYETQVFDTSQNLRVSAFLNASANYDSAVRQVIDLAQADRHAQLVAQTAFEGDIDFVPHDWAI